MSPRMSSTLLLRRTLPTPSTRSFSTTRPTPASLLFALGQLSNTRETQHFAKRSKLDHVEHSPPLQLIRSSEVDPFAAPKKAKATKSAAGTRAASIKQEFERNMAQSDFGEVAPLTGVPMNVDTSPFDARLASATQELTARLERSGRDIQDLEKGLADMQKELGALVKTFGLLMFLLVGGVTGVAMWSFWPQEKNARTGAELGKKVAERTRAAIPLPAAGSSRREVGTQTGLEATNASLAEVMGEAAVLPVAASAVSAQPAAPAAQTGPGSQDDWRWYKNLFWKQR